MIIGVILARKGSKRLPGKNIIPFAGVPLVQWTIMEAMKAEMLDRVVVSTDYPEVAKIAFKEGATVVPRPDQYAQDTSTSYEALDHLINSLRLYQDIIVLLQPTSPMRTASDIDECVNAAYANADRTAISVEEGKKEGNGAIYVANASWLTTGGNWDDFGPARYEMPANRSHDIDTLEDFKAAESTL